MKKTPILFFSGICFGFAVCAAVYVLQQKEAVPATIESEHTEAVDGEERIKHYAAVEPESPAAAQAEFEKADAKVAEILKAKSLDDSALEALHEQTYSMEAAVEYMHEHAPYKGVAALDSVDEAVQALHYSSENHHEAEARQWYGKLKAAWAQLPHGQAASAE